MMGTVRGWGGCRGVVAGCALAAVLGLTPASPAQTASGAGGGGEAAAIADKAIKSRFGADGSAATRVARPTSDPFAIDAEPLRAAPVAPAVVVPPPAPASNASPDVPPIESSAPAREQRPLGPAASAQGAARGEQAGAKRGGGGILDHWLVRTVGALSVVIALIFVSRRVLVKLSGTAGGLPGQFGAGGRAPSGLVEIIGRYPVARGHTLVLLRLDRRLLLLGHSGEGFTTLSELTDPDEVASILIKARDEEGESMAARFGALLRGMERDPAVAATDFDEARAPALTTPRLAMRRQGEERASAGTPAMDGGQELARRLERLRGITA